MPRFLKVTQGDMVGEDGVLFIQAKKSGNSVAHAFPRGGIRTRYHLQRRNLARVHPGNG